jgi:hypothetical protein
MVPEEIFHGGKWLKRARKSSVGVTQAFPGHARFFLMESADETD